MTDCAPNLRLDAEEALVVVEPYWRELQKQFASSGLRKVTRTRLEIDGSVHDTPRHFAAASTDGLHVLVAPEIAALPEPHLVAILAHELGHACDYAYPARFQLADGRLLEWDHPDWGTRRKGAELDPRTSYARVKQWEQRSDDDIERVADAIAGRVLKRPIRYAGPCLLQTVGAGISPRPLGLR